MCIRDRIYSGQIASFFEAPRMMIENPFILSGILVLMNFAFMFPLFYGLAALLKTVPCFENKNYFDPIVTKSFQKASISFIASGIAGIILQLIYPFILKSKLTLNLDSKTLLYLFIIMIGLFFSFLREVFIQARGLKNENDLTI